MKKGVVLSVNKFSITLLTPDGEFEKTRRLHRNYEIGEEIIYQPSENLVKSFLYFSGKKTAVISAVVTCIMLFSIIIPHFSTHVSAYMTIDVNPSIELGLDDHLQVVKIRGINTDGQRVISHIQEWKNKDVSDVAEKIVLKTKELGYMDDMSTHKIIVSKTMVEDDKKLDERLNQEIKGFTNEMHIDNTDVKLIHATETDRKKAKQYGISTGKFIEKKLDEEKRKNEKHSLEKKNNNQSKKDDVTIPNSCKKDNKVSNKAHIKETYRNYASPETLNKNQTDIAVLNNKSNDIENKHQFESSENSTIKSNSGNKGNSKIKSNPNNKGNSKIKNNPGNKENSKTRSNPSNKENSKIKSNPGNKGNSKIKSNPGNKGNSKYKSNPGNRGNAKNKNNPGHSGNKHNS